MTNKAARNLEARCARYSDKISPEIASLMQCDFGVVTTRMANHERRYAEDLRAAARQLADELPPARH